MNMNQELNFVSAFPTERRATLKPGCSEKWVKVARSSSRSDAPHRLPDVVSNEQGFPHFYERVRVKKLAHKYRIRLVSWNIGSLTGRLTELVDAIVRRNVSILCMQETKWVMWAIKKITEDKTLKREPSRGGGRVLMPDAEVAFQPQTRRSPTQTSRSNVRRRGH